MAGDVFSFVRHHRRLLDGQSEKSLVRIGTVYAITGDVVDVEIAGGVVENVSYLLPLTAIVGDRVALTECDGDLILLSKVMRGTPI